MDKDTLLRELRYEQKKHENDKLSTFQTSISAMLRDCIAVVEELASALAASDRKANAAIADINNSIDIDLQCDFCKKQNVCVLDTDEHKKCKYWEWNWTDLD
jgi:hypothetical protein